MKECDEKSGVGKRFSFRVRVEFRDEGHQSATTYSVTRESDGKTHSVVVPSGKDMRHIRAAYRELLRFWIVQFDKSPSSKDRAQTFEPYAKADVFLKDALGAMQSRAKEYDKPEGERSAAAVASVFNALKGREVLSETDVWQLLVILKMVRFETSPNLHRDSVVDGAAYFALMGESKGRSDRGVEENGYDIPVDPLDNVQLTATPLFFDDDSGRCDYIQIDTGPIEGYE